MLIAPTEAARHRQQVVVPKDTGVFQEVGGVDPVRLGPGEIEGEGGLVVAVEAVAVEDQGPSAGGGSFLFSVFCFLFPYKLSLFNLFLTSLKSYPNVHDIFLKLSA